MGRQKTPTKTKIIKGTFQKCREVKNEIDFPAIENGTPPAELDKEGAKVWRRIFPYLQERGLATVADEFSLLTLCYVAGQLLTIKKEMQRQGLVYERTNTAGEKVQTENTYVKIYSRLLPIYITLSAKFGLTPADRARMDLPTSTKSDLTDEFIRRG